MKQYALIELDLLHSPQDLTDLIADRIYCAPWINQRMGEQRKGVCVQLISEEQAIAVRTAEKLKGEDFDLPSVEADFLKPSQAVAPVLEEHE